MSDDKIAWGDNETTWRELITAEMLRCCETWDDVERWTPSTDIDRLFYAGFGGHRGQPFTLWTANRVYFPVVYDGAEWVGSVPRDPCDEATEHQGGE